MRLTGLEDAALISIVRNLREWDRREIFATRWNDDPLALVDDCLAAVNIPGAVSFLAWGASERPVAAFGAYPISPGCFRVWLFGTDAFATIGKRLTLSVRRSIFPGLVRAGMRRAECMSMEGHTEAHAWLESLGGVRESGPLLDRGRNGETFFLYAWRASDREGH